MSNEPLIPVSADLSNERIAALLTPVQEAIGFIPQALQLHAISPELLASQVQRIGYFMQHQVLSQNLLSMIRLFVSKQDDCAYCIDLNEAFLVNNGVNLEVLRKSYTEPTTVPLEENDKALFLFAIKAIGSPKNVTAKALVELKEFGWHNQDVFDAISLGAEQMSFDLMLNVFNVKDEPALAQ